MTVIQWTITLALLAATFGWGWLAGRRDTRRDQPPPRRRRPEQR